MATSLGPALPHPTDDSHWNGYFPGLCTTSHYRPLTLEWLLHWALHYLTLQTTHTGMDTSLGSALPHPIDDSHRDGYFPGLCTTSHFRQLTLGWLNPWALYYPPYRPLTWGLLLPWILYYCTLQSTQTGMATSLELCTIPLYRRLRLGWLLPWALYYPTLQTTHIGMATSLGSVISHSTDNSHWDGYFPGLCTISPYR